MGLVVLGIDVRLVAAVVELVAAVVEADRGERGAVLAQVRELGAVGAFLCPLAVFSPGGHQGENLSANFPRAPLGLAEAGLGAASS